jgi:hypothetical protein
MRVGALAAAVGLMGLAVGVASSSPAGAATQTVTFDDHLCATGGGAQTWVVPAGVTSATFDVFGAQGGNGGGMVVTTAPGGNGGETVATVAVTPGESIQVNVGCRGTDSPSNTAGAGGFNGGADGGLGVNAGGGGGGGASDVRQAGTALANRVVVAGGGGGGGGVLSAGALLATGGTGGGANGGDGVSSDLVSGAGTGGTPSVGGTRGGCQQPTCLGVDGSAGSGGAGGGSVAAANLSAGGGGGGGLFGGGGGGGDTNNSEVAGGGGGGGGSGFGGTTTAGVRTGDGLVTITFDGGATPTTPTESGSGTSAATPLTIAPHFTG